MDIMRGLLLAVVCGPLTAFAEDVENVDSANVLHEVVVQAEEAVRVDGHLTIRPTSDQKRLSANGYSLLDNLMIPGLQIDYRTGAVTAMGFRATLYINGVEADPRSVMNIRPKDIVKIEYIDSPSGKYAKDQLAINYVVKQYTYGGYVDADALQTIGYGHGDYNVASSVSHGPYTYSLFAGGRYYNVNNISTDQTDRYRFDSAPVSVERQSASKAHRNNEYAQLRIERQSSGKYLLGKLTLVRDATPHNDADGTERTGDATEEYASFSSQRSLSPRLDLNGQYNLTSSQFLSFGLHGIYSRNHYRRDYSTQDFHSIANEKEDAYSGKLGLIYNNKLSRGTFTAELFQYINVHDATYLGTHPAWQHLWKNETIGFVSYSTKLSPTVRLQGRLGFDWYQFRLHGHSRHSTLNPRAALSLQWQRRSQMLNWNVILANSNYGMDVLNDATIDINQYMQSRGLTSLRRNASIQTYLYYNARFGKWMLSAVGQYAHDFHPVANRYAIEGDKVLCTFTNDGHNDIVNLSLGTTYRITPKLAVSADARFSHLSTKAIESFSHGYVTANARAQWQTGNLMLLAGINLKKKEFSAYSLYLYEYPLSYSFRATYAYRNFIFGFDAQTPFNTSRIRGSIDTDAYASNLCTVNESYHRHCSLSVKYNCDFGRKINKVKKDVDTSANSSLMKVE